MTLSVHEMMQSFLGKYDSYLDYYLHVAVLELLSSYTYAAKMNFELTNRAKS